MDDIEQDIAKIKAVFDKMETENEKDLPPEINQLRHYILFLHELTLSEIHFLLTVALYKVKKPRNIAKLAQEMNTASHMLRELGLKSSVDACKNMKLIDNKEADKIMKVNSYRNKFSHPEQHREEYKKYENRDEYMLVLLNIFFSFDTVRKAIFRYQKRPARKAFTLGMMSQRLSEELKKPVDL